MKYIVPLLICITQFITGPAQAQCNAGFTYTVAENAVSFLPSLQDSLRKQHQWYFGDGGLFFGTDPTHTYNMPGQYTVRHIVYDSTSSCIDSLWQTINVQFTPKCSVRFWYYNNNVYRNEYNFFANPSTAGGTTQFTWKINDSVVGRDAQLYYRFPKVGSYNVCAVVETSYGCAAENCQQINVISTDSCPLSQVSFMAKKDTVNNLRFSFKPQPDSSGYLYNWDFGDGSISAERYPIHTFVRAGNYFVKMVVFSSNKADSCSAIAYDFVYADSTPKGEPKPDSCHLPVPSFIASADSSNPLLFHFNQTPFYPNYSLLWQFGDGTFSTDSLPTHLYNAPGFYTVNLTIKTGNNFDSCMASTTQQLVVRNDSDQACIIKNISFVASPLAENPLRVSFTPVPDSAAYFYEWQFDGGVMSWNKNPVITFNNAGNHTVSVLVKTNRADSCTGFAQRTINLSAPDTVCTASFNWYADSTSSTGNKIHFVASGSQPFISQQWSVYKWDSLVTLLNQVNPVYTFTDTGYHQVCVKATAANGCVAYYCAWIYIAQVSNQDTSQNSSDNTVKVYPNPASNEVRFNLELNSTQQIRITIYNSQGMPVKQETQAGIAGTNQVKINIQTLQPGLYFSEIIYGTNRKTARFQKQ